MIWILFYYNSLPDFPKQCKIVSPNVMLRDFFKCNPYNTNHYQYPKFETMSYDEGCHGREVRSFICKEDSDKYAVFYTRHVTINRDSKNKVVGYFKVGRTYINNKRRGFFSSETVLLPKNRCIEINYRSRGVPVSWGRSSIKDEINTILSDLIKIKDDPSKNIERTYEQATKDIMRRLASTEGREDLFLICKHCEAKNCFLWKKFIRRKGMTFLDEMYMPQKATCQTCLT